MIHKNGTSMIVGKQPTSKAKEIQIQQDDNGILRTNYQRRMTVNGSSQTKRNQ